jgi:hypothetical protein
MRLLAAAALLALCACASAADPATAAVDARQRACRAALGVLRRCAFSSSTHEELRTRCCSLLDTFTANGCLCPPGSNCEGSDLSNSAAGVQLSVQLAPIMELCAPTPAANAIESAAVPAQEAEEALPLEAEEEDEEAAQVYDEDDAMADMAGLAASAQDPRTPRADQEQPSSRTLPLEDVAPLMDTPTDDYDNWLTDADAAFMLVDPAFASSYASRAEEVLSKAGGAVADDVAVLRGEAAGVANAAEGRLQHLLASLDMSLEELEQKLAAVNAMNSAEATAEADPEEVASAAAVSDDSSLTTSSAADPQLAPVDAVPQTAEQRRAAALAAALERMQERNLVQQGSQTVETDDAESAHQLADNVLTMLKSWQASAYSADTQAELVAALQATAQRVVASASLGRSGLQPRQLLLQQAEAQRQQHSGSFDGGDEPRACTCMSVQFDENDELYDDLATALRRRYISARLALCRFACTHQHTLAFLLVAELALCLAWLLVWAVRGSILPSSSDDCDSPTHVQRGCPQESQFVVASATDPQWQAELQQPLLETRGSATDSC